jgi:putative phosphoserine phosphatase/1-acylglycerol-3-phosphate O-acyltransferase
MTRLTAGRASVVAPQAELAAAALSGAALAGAAPTDLAAAEGELLAVLRSGRSVAIAPEGERSITRSIGAFDAMPFHVARRARVPVVPVAIHDAGELMWRGARAVRRGTVRVTVLEPIVSDGWRAADVPDHAKDVRRAIADALRRQPAQLTGPATST